MDCIRHHHWYRPRIISGHQSTHDCSYVEEKVTIIIANTEAAFEEFIDKPISQWKKMAAILADDIFKCIFLNENDGIPIEISTKFVPMHESNWR